MRLNRKLEHIEFSLRQKNNEGATGFSDITLLHNPLPQLNWDEVDTSCAFLGQRLKAPLLINAMTGGHPQLESINRSLAAAAAAAGVALAVGSQRAALEDCSTRSSFTVVREVNPHGVILANLGAGCTLAEAKEAVDMIKADAIQLHLNAPQELAMEEGDRKFRGVLENIRLLAQNLEVPVIVKEVGFGMPKETIRRLVQAGVRHIDIGGAGGTDFIAIEQARAGKEAVYSWGIPTAVSLLEGLAEGNHDIQLIASGGIRNAIDSVKALVLGCFLVGMARPLLEIVIQESERSLIQYLKKYIEEIRRLMLMLGARTVQDLKKVPVVINGPTYHWMCRRGIPVDHYARRQGLL
ncbi:type 2 isopentenyl-diphosphate Delta-isomerase [Desulforamulus hydrothermalis]|uniref:Isopentenyl-diphosphate delta-isomerase n=1 Tax=Desulforamulus hydrothermalis Lam5 = DSM 18033 TaxID=1121428 RepID=K8DZ78_9FIRM|nr:type 2 isopentenyl-diphosphate Delta-isomerase [Desulforamulus hydrothermalis]CCO08225.1 Isopentenyl-diphosphate delta-isomerase [Desulforamulus hydrothermalis Lam5 = DSM 18033]SHH22055.1 isopentenyl-diphosphate delta-isomerase [Desulforamulus hydrothermalis Lam5 = DSM 18033]